MLYDIYESYPAEGPVASEYVHPTTVLFGKLHSAMK
jgi:hypothetical protein